MTKKEIIKELHELIKKNLEIAGVPYSKHKDLSNMCAELYNLTWRIEQGEIKRGGVNDRRRK